MRLGKIISQAVAAGLIATIGFSLHSQTLADQRSEVWTATLDQDHRRQVLHDLDVILADTYRGPLPVRVQVDCVDQQATPPLAVDAAIYGPDARLLNLTRRSEHGCNSYEIHFVSGDGRAGGPDVVLTAAPAEQAASGIAVGVHRSGPAATDRQIKDPAVFVFNPVHGNWTEAKPFKPLTQEPQRLYATLAEGRQRIIAGVIALPDTLQAEPTKSSPALLAKPLQQVSPLDGYLGVDRIEPDSRGAYSVDLPLLLRPSRGPGPSVSIRYSSQGAPGVLGRGWDLVVSSIEVRGSSPIYHPDHETEDYVLDGMDLIALDGNGTEIQPLYKGGPILPRVKKVRIFRPRNNTGGLIIRRHGDAPGSYYWEVWDPHAHVTKLYGGKLDKHGKAFEFNSDGNGLMRQRLASGGSVRDVIGQWGLTQEFDNQRARNGAEYAYHKSETTARSCDASWGGGPCKAALRLDWAEYNKAFAVPQGIIESGITRLSFEWKQRSTARFNSDGRLGFLRTYEFWLDKLYVLYRPEKQTVIALRPDGYALFAEHAFERADGHACLNFDTVLKSYSVKANAGYDLDRAKSQLERQTFNFDYEGEKFAAKNGGCDRPWQEKLSSDGFGDLAEPAGGTFAFPSKLLGDLGFGALAKQSFLGTSRTEETGASMYVGIGPVGNTSSKEITVGVKGGVNFSKSQGNSILVDVTGDGIDDIVYRSGEGLRYCAGIRDDAPPHAVTYPKERCGVVEGISEFSISNASTQSIGAEYYPGFSSFAGVGFNSSNSDTYVYFTDRDGDGLLDLVSYGRVFYGQGEDKANKIVSFVPRSSLTPPIPGDVAAHKLQSHLPVDVRDTIRDIESKLEAVTRRLSALHYTQTTIAWEAPLDGSVTIAGQFIAGTSTPDPNNAGALGQDFGPDRFKMLADQVSGYQAYIDRRFDCRLWPWDEVCYEGVSNPFSPHYARRKTQIGFIDVPNPKVQIALFQRQKALPASSVTVCAEASQTDVGFDLAALPIDAMCQPANGGGKLIQVKAGDVVYVTYSVHPHFGKWLKPTARISYARVSDDPAFAILQAGDPNKVLASLGCNWKEAVAGPGSECLLARQTRYDFDLLTGAVASAPSDLAGLPPGKERKLEGRFEIPADLAQDYQVYLDILAARVPDTERETRPDFENLPPFSNTKPASAPRRLFRQDVSAGCGAVTGSCIVDIAPLCDAAASTECAAFASDQASQYRMAARIVVEHRLSGTAAQVRNVDQRLSALTWRKPPQVTSVFIDAEGKLDPTGTRMAVYLPVTMGDPDLEYLRIEEGKFTNPDTKLTDKVPEPAIIDFKDLMADEKLNVELARLRQMVGLCDFADEILGFLGSRFSTNGQPYADNYLTFWKDRTDPYGSRCQARRKTLSDVKFVDGDGRPYDGVNGLRLPQILLRLSYAEQITSAETLLERVLRNLALGEEFLIDSPRLTRRGYRLPIKVNPLDCDVISSLAAGLASAPAPVEKPFVGTEEQKCTYRLSSNFAMQELEDLGITGAAAKNIRDVFAGLAAGSVPAFDLELTATVNGVPVEFRELSGEKTGNEGCTPITAKTCMGNYGTIDEVNVGTPADYFYPKQQANSNLHGDVFQRITTNKRTGRVVAFSNSIIDDKVSALCERNFPRYRSLGEIEAKQDCLFPQSDIATEGEKYLGRGLYAIRYTIGENNHFIGRNRVFEFKANPLDVLELRFRLAGANNTVQRNPQDTSPEGRADTIGGAFSIIESPPGIATGRYLVPRSPSQILPNGDIALSCPPQTAPGSRLPATCRPWTRLGWTEVFLGAQYRTYSDAQKVGAGQPTNPNTYSIERRRELLRLHPEIEVEADRYLLEHDQQNFVRVSELKLFEHEAYSRRDPNIKKTGGNWTLFASKAVADGGLKTPPPFSTLPRAAPPQSLRYGLSLFRAENSLSDSRAHFDDVKQTCDAANYDGCRGSTTAMGRQALNLEWFDFTALAHRFVGPAKAVVSEAAIKSIAERQPTGVCAAEDPAAVAHCWKGIDDTVFLEAAIGEAFHSTVPYSVSALWGFERPPLAEFNYRFESYRKVACLDPESPQQPDVGNPPKPFCMRDSVAPTPAAPKYPNRPIPPKGDRVVEVFGPVQSTISEAISLNGGVNWANANRVDGDRRATRLFIDINGDGFPDVVSDGRAELTSPVGLTRHDWWTYFQAAATTSTPDFQAVASDFLQTATSTSLGAGIGVSASTFAKIDTTRKSGSPDANVDPGFDFSLDNGNDTKFSELRDFNGDGLVDKVGGSTTNAELELSFNVGNGLQAAGNVPGVGASQPFNSTHGTSLGARLGFSFGAGSFIGGAGLGHRDGGSQAAFFDFTGDGRPDIVLPIGGGRVDVYPNLGNGFGPKRTHVLANWHWKTANPALTEAWGTSLYETTLLDAGTAFTAGTNFAPYFRIVANPGVKWARNQTRELLSIRDVNGDGVPDIVAVGGEFLMPDGNGPLDTNSVATQVHYNPEGKYHLLSGITNPSGSRWLMRHELYGNTGPEHGRPVWALTSVARYDGFEPTQANASPLPEDGHDVLLTNYKYRLGYYNRAERQFYGFAERTSSVYGCDLATKGSRCIESMSDVVLDEHKAGYRPLQIITQTFSNRDFLTQGLELSKIITGMKSLPVVPGTPGEEQAVSLSESGYSIDQLTSRGGTAPRCRAVPAATAASWSKETYAIAGSKLSALWDWSISKPEWPILGAGGVCQKVGGCLETLRDNMCSEGFEREQVAFWAQQSGAVRQRLSTLEVFGGNVPADDMPKTTDRLRSAMTYDHDQFGQLLSYDNIGEATSSWEPVEGSSTHATIAYAGLADVDRMAATGRPLLGLASQIRIFGWQDRVKRNTPLRMRESLYHKDRTGNVSDICLYPGGDGFVFASGMCQAFRDTMQVALADGYTSMQSALRLAYDRNGLPKGVASFDAIVHQQLRSYDDFGNVTHAVSPLSQNREWIERRFDYTRDPFRLTATATELTRCVNDVPGVGIDSPGFKADKAPRCTFGLAAGALPDPVQRKAITHVSNARIDTHFGRVVETRDINSNSVLHDLDRWGRLTLVARSWGNAPAENETFKDSLVLAVRKTDRPTHTAETAVKDWRILALVDYAGEDGLLRSNVRRFESSAGYAGLLGGRSTTRETALFTDGLGRTIQSIREADVCLSSQLGLLPEAQTNAGLREYCTSVSTGIAVPAASIDALGRALQTFEPYAIDSNPIDPKKAARRGSEIRFTDLVIAPSPVDYLTRTTYDAGGRPERVESRLSKAQYRYSIVKEDLDAQPPRAARFEALSLSPRCTAAAVWSDARGLKQGVFEDQENFYPKEAGLPLPALPDTRHYSRDYSTARGNCQEIDQVWTDVSRRDLGKRDGGQPARVSYVYDPLEQLTSVEYPLEGKFRRQISIRFDGIGRTVNVQDPDSGCTSYGYDGLNLLVSETGYGYGSQPGERCGTSTKVRNEKSYTYSGDRLTRMAYRSLEEQGGPVDEGDAVQFYYDRYPHASLFGEVLETRRLVPNDQANQRLIDVIGRKCDNCVGQVTVVSDRSGARAFSFNELGLPRREIRSIVAPLRDLEQRGGNSETYVPEVGFYEIESAFTAFGDPLQEKFAESAPINPSKACVAAGVATCLARFSIGRKYAADGTVAQLLFNGRPLVSAAQDALGRSVVRWTSSGIATTYVYDPLDLRLNQMVTRTAAGLKVQSNGYQYDATGNVLAYANDATTLINGATTGYLSQFAFQYDAANRISRFGSATVRQLEPAHGGEALPPLQEARADGGYSYDPGHRLRTRILTILGTSAGAPPTSLQRAWRYDYNNDPGAGGPVHAPRAIAFTENDKTAHTDFRYDDVGRLTRIGVNPELGSEARLLSNRALTWDAEGRLKRVRGVADKALPANEALLRQDYVYDSGGNRTAKIDPLPREQATAAAPPKEDKAQESAILYMTPFYARPFDRRGTVQLAQGSLPTVSLAAPADPGEDAVATYLFSDLSVGSMTASVAVFGEATDAGSTLIARREYSPFGLELTNDTLVNRVDKTAPLSVFHGKELDRLTNFSSFGGRYYSRDVAMWLGPDPLLATYLAGTPNGGVFNSRNLNRYSVDFQNPTIFTDRTGNNPGICYSGTTQVFACADFRSGNSLLDNTVLGAANQTINLIASVGNVTLDAFGAVSTALEPYSSDIDAFAYSLQAVGPYGQLVEAPLLGVSSSLRQFSALARSRITPVILEDAARSVTSGVRLGKALASESQMAEVGEIIAGPNARKAFRDAPRVAKQYGGAAQDWVKKASSSYLSKDGTRIETHWVENLKTGAREEFKSIVTRP